MSAFLVLEQKKCLWDIAKSSDQAERKTNQLFEIP
jgi:hypothetical protein